MAVLSKLRDYRGFIYHAARMAILAAAISLLPAAVNALRADDTLDVVVDQARMVKLPERVSTVVIGNPLIADATVRTGGLMVLTGKGYGITNLIALDGKGNTLLEKIVQVHAPGGDIVVVYKGVNRETYSCAPICQPRITLGDGQQYFTQTLTQTTVRSTQASAMAK